MNDYKLTQSGIDELKAEAADLKKRQPEVAESIRVAREFGDLSENAEYATAKDEAIRIEKRLQEIEHIIGNAEIIKSAATNEVSLGNNVQLSANGKTVEYTVVGSMEANPLEHRISDESPIGLALLGKKVGEEVVIKLPAGETKYKVKKIS